MSLSTEQERRINEWGIDSLEQVDDHPFAWWARQAEEYVVVKAGDPGERAREARALLAFGAGATDVLAHDEDLGLLVTRRILPGDDIRPLARSDDDAATREIALVAARLHMEQAGYPLHIIHQYDIPAEEARAVARLIAVQSAKSLEKMPGVSRRRVDTLPLACLALVGTHHRINNRKPQTTSILTVALARCIHAIKTFKDSSLILCR